MIVFFFYMIEISFPIESIPVGLDQSYNDWKSENHYRFENLLYNFQGSKIQVSFPYRFQNM